MKKYYIFIIVLVIILLGIIGWVLLFKKAGVGEECNVQKDCYSDLNCVNNRCSDGKEGSPCDTYKDCKDNLLCKGSVCVSKPQLPSYSKYFSKIELQKMKNGVAPGPNNIPVASTEFKTTDGMNVDMILKDEIEGEVYFDMIDSVSGEIIFIHPKFDAKGSMGRGFPAPPEVGQYDLNIYFDSELIHTISFKVVE